ALNHFDPKVLAKLKRLSLRARLVVDGVMIGIHPSRAKGLSAEFEEHREYSQGDDVRRIDWKAYAKFDRYFIKEYRQTTNLKAHIILDSSSSMGYASNGWSKYDYGSTLTAALAYLMLKQQDAVGLITYSDRIERIIPPKAVHEYLFAILRELEGSKPRGVTRTGAVLQELAGSLKRRGIILLLSDLLDEPEEVLKGLKQLRSRGNDIIVFHLLDQDELGFPFNESTLFQDLEEDLKLLADPRTVRAAYLKALQSLIENYRRSCASELIDYSLFDTSAGLDRALVRYLHWREKLRRHA
ncbi:MAG: DUF58 domain-containing protein, partial [Deltaproteobacteria bacterium]